MRGGEAYELAPLTGGHVGSFATEPAGAAAGAYDPQFYMQRFG